MSEDTREQLKREFETHFVHTWRRAWSSEKAADLFVDVSYWQDHIVGPIYHINETGGCLYVYDRDDEHFDGINNPDDLGKRLQDWHQHAIDEIGGFEPSTDGELADQQFLFTTMHETWKVVETALTIERLRWAKAN